MLPMPIRAVLNSGYCVWTQCVERSRDTVSGLMGDLREVDQVERLPMPGKALLDQFSALEDPRQSWTVVCPLPEILLAMVCATMAGADDFVEIERWANRKLDFLRRFLPFENGVRSHDTHNDVLNAPPADAVSACFVAWVESLHG